MKLKTAMLYQNKFIMQLRGIYSSARSFSYSHAKLIEEKLCARNSNAFKKCPRHLQEYIRGYDMALYDALWAVMIPVYLSLKTGEVYLRKYPESSCAITFLGHAWPCSTEDSIRFYSKRTEEEIQEEREKRTV